MVRQVSAWGWSASSVFSNTTGASAVPVTARWFTRLAFSASQASVSAPMPLTAKSVKSASAGAVTPAGRAEERISALAQPSAGTVGSAADAGA